MTEKPTTTTTTLARKRLPTVVVALGFVSLFNDAASEMIYPLLPAFVATLGRGPEMLGLIEGVAEATASLFKLVSGALADRIGRTKALTLVGYVLANLLRPLMALAGSAWQVLLIRFGDRLGKGIRTTPRDVLLANSVVPEERGRAFGFHRAMDHAGAVLGPLCAFSLLGAGLGLRSIFVWTLVPGALAVLVLALRVRDVPGARTGKPPQPLELGLAPSAPYRRFLVAMAVFTLAGSSDVFLLWRAQELGIGLKWIPLVWALLHVAKSATSTWGGALSDRMPRGRVIAAGWLVYAVVYAAIGLCTSAWQIWPLLGLYGLYFGLTEGTEKAFIVDLVPSEWRGRALGLFHATMGIGVLVSNLVFGWIYRLAGARLAFGAAAGCALLAITLLPKTTAYSSAAAR